MAKRNKKTTNKKKQHSPLKRFVSVFMMLIACFLTYSAAEEVITTIQLKQEIADSNAELEALKEKEAVLQDEKVKLEDEEYVKRYARGKYQLSKEGETIYKIPKEDDVVTDTETEPTE